MSELLMAAAKPGGKRNVSNVKRKSISSIFAPLPSSTRNLLNPKQNNTISPDSSPISSSGSSLPTLGKQKGITIRSNRIHKQSSAASTPYQGELKEIFARLNQTPQFTYLADGVPIPEISESSLTPSQDSEIEALSSHICKCQGNMPPNEFESLFQVLKSQLFRKFPPVPLRLFQADVPALITLSNWKFVINFYHILSFLIRLSPRPLLQQYFNKSFITELCHLVHSPDPNEQNALNAILIEVFEKFQEYQEIIPELLLIELQGFLDGQSNGSCIRPILNFFVQYYKFQFTQTPVTPINVFKQSFVVLFRNSNLGDFYAPLSLLCTEFYQRDDSLAVYVINTLFHFWPYMNSTKQVMFLHHITLAVPFLTPTELMLLSQMIFHKIGQCLDSDNFKVILGALRMISDQKFLFNFSNQARTLNYELLGPITSLQNHWNEDVKSQAYDAASCLQSLTMKSNTKFLQHDQEKLAEQVNEKKNLRKEKWDLIQNIAAKKTINN